METENGYVIYRHNGLNPAYVEYLVMGLNIVMFAYIEPVIIKGHEFKHFSLSAKKEQICNTLYPWKQ